MQSYGKDIFLLRSALPDGLTPAAGQAVHFTVVQGDRGLQAANVRPLGARSGGGGSGAPRPSSARHQQRGAAPRPSMAGGCPWGPGPPSQQHMGVVKSFNDAKGWGFVGSDMIQHMYGKDVLIRRANLLDPSFPLHPGQHISFTIAQGEKGPMAEHIAPCMPVPAYPSNVVGGGFPFPPPAFFGGPPPFGGPPMPMPLPGGSKIKEGDRLLGTVKSYNEEKGWGHIDCPPAKDAFGKDIFLMRSAVGEEGVQAGASVSFKLVLGQKGPQAAELIVLPPGALEATFVGEVKSFKEEKGWGFVTSERVRQTFGKDIFLHKRELGGEAPAVGDPISFTVEMKPNGQLEAKNVSLAPDAAEEDAAYGAVPPRQAPKKRPGPY